MSMEVLPCFLDEGPCLYEMDPVCLDVAISVLYHCNHKCRVGRTMTRDRYVRCDPRTDLGVVRCMHVTWYW
jgi:hypothetical protein